MDKKNVDKKVGMGILINGEMDPKKGVVVEVPNELNKDKNVDRDEER